ncbi:hypothetical protein, partial [Streptococcus suis]|uniref:hypothetical protein n=1 Tax=Streptococcus suis TaxID=1307 RepID=UPI00345BF172
HNCKTTASEFELGTSRMHLDYCGFHEDNIPQLEDVSQSQLALVSAGQPTPRVEWAQRSRL